MVLKYIREIILGQSPNRTPSPPSRPKPQQSSDMDEPWRKVKTRVFSTRDFSVPIVGESHYQNALRRSRDRAKDYESGNYITAVLAREPDNQFDPGAVKVMNGDLDTIGYLSRDRAREYVPAIELWESAGYQIRCQARLVGGQGKRNIGAYLDLDTPQAMETTYHNPRTRK